MIERQVNEQTRREADAVTDSIAVYPQMAARQYATGKCTVCGAGGETPVTPIRFGTFDDGVAVLFCDTCRELTGIVFSALANAATTA